MNDSTNFDEALKSAIERKDISKAHSLLTNLIAPNTIPGFLTPMPSADQERQIFQLLRKMKIVQGIQYKDIKRYYGIHPNIYIILEKLLTEELTKIEPEIFTPIQPATAKRYDSPEAVSNKNDNNRWIVEPKFDGWYCQVHVGRGKTKLFSRNGKDFSNKLLNLNMSFSQLFPENNYIFEGEIIPTSKSTGNILPRTKLFQSDTIPIIYLFDCLYFKSNCCELGYAERLNYLVELDLSKDSPIRVVENHIVESKEDFKAQFHYWNNLGYEGMIAKNPNTKYEANLKGEDFLKIKRKDTIDAVILGFTDTSPKSYLLGLDNNNNDFIPFAWITPKKEITSENTFIMDPNLINSREIGGRVLKTWVKPEIIVEISGDKIYKTDIFSDNKVRTGLNWSLFSPSFISIRDDKALSEVTTVEEFLNLPKMAGYE